MLGLVHVVWRALMAVAGALAGWAPVVLAAVWGGVYVSNCLNALTAPGVPIEYRYESEAGTVQVVAAGYWYDPETGQAVVRKVRATAPDGTVVASVEKIELLLSSDVPVITLSDASVVVKRLADGSFDIADLLPVMESDEPSEGAFRIVVHNATVTYSDERVPGRSTNIELRQAQADVADGSVLFRTLIDGETLKGEVGGTYGADGTLWAEVELDNAQLAPLLHYINPDLPEDLLGEFAHVSAQSFTADGRLEIWSRPDEPTLVTGSVHLTGAAVTSPESLHAANVHADLASDGTNISLNGTVTQAGFAASFDGDMTFKDAFRLTGGLTFEIADRESMPPQVAPFIDLEIAFQNASFDGWIDTDGERFLLDGLMEAGEIAYAGERTGHVQAAVRLSNDGVTARIDGGEWAGVPYYGAVAVGFADGSLSGHLQTLGGRIEPIAEHFGTNLVEGTVSLTAIISGTVDSPVAEVYAEGTGDLRRGEGDLLSLGQFNVRGRIDAEGAKIDRLTMTGLNGVLTAQGSITWAEKLLDFTVDGGGVELNAIDSGVEGLAFFDGQLSGTLDEPVASGRLEIYGVKAFERVMPQIAADWTADADRLRFVSVAARAGTGQLSGTGSMSWADRALEGEFSGSGIRLEEWLALETVGAVSVEDGKLSGTLDAPLVSARLKTEEVFVFGVRVDSVEADVEADARGVVSPSFVVRLGEGELTGNAAYVREGTLGFVNGSFTDLPLARVPISEDVAALGGSATGSLELFFDDTGLGEGKMTVDQLTSVSVNGTVVGRGFLDASLSDGVISADGQVGSTYRYVLMSDATYDFDKREVGGEVLVFDMKVEDIAAMVERPTSDWPDQATGILKNLAGLARADVAISGSVDDPEIEVRSATLKSLALRGRQAGELAVSGKRIGGTWDIEHLGWQVGDMHLDLNGQVSETGEFNATGALKNFDVSWLNTFVPELPLYSGKANLENIDVSGTFDDPQGVATLSLSDLGYFDGPDAVNLQLSLDDMITTVHDRQVDLDGRVQYKGLSGPLVGVVPFSSLYEGDEERRPMNVVFELKERPFSSFAPYFSSLDEGWSEGMVWGSATLAGLSGELSLDAEFWAVGSSLALVGQETALTDVDFHLTMRDWKADLVGSFSSSLGGDARLDLHAQSPDLFAGEVTATDLPARTALSGVIELNEFSTRFRILDANRTSRTSVSSDSLEVSGTLAAPEFAGTLAFSDLYVRLPNNLPADRTAIVYAVNPVFSGLVVTAADGSELDSGNAQIQFLGSGTINGSLQNPDLSLPLQVSGGVFRLPTARITLESGGSINVAYQSQLGAAPSASVGLNLEGRTTVSARRADNEYETYQVQLNIKGDLLSESGLRIEARSDPPDLSSDQIMAILGHKDLIENFALSGSNTGALASAALPAAAGIFTAEFASDLKLDYIALDYNPFDQAVAGLGKTLARGLMVHGRRQLSTPAGSRLKYEVQLTYRLPLEDAFFSRLRLGLGMDQDVPWRLRLNWARRF